nr:hypothetical protein [Tanacetum cinerariifolium]
AYHRIILMIKDIGTEVATGNKSYLFEYEPFNEGYVSFGNGRGKIIGKGLIITDFKIVDDKHVFLRTLRQQNMYTIDLKNSVPHKNLTCLIAKASVDESMLWNRKLGHLNFKTMNKLVRSNLVKGLPSKSFENDHSCVACLKGKQYKASYETSRILRNFIREIENLKDLKVKIIRIDNGGEFRNKEIDEFCSRKGIKRDFSNIRTPQQNGVAERRNMTRKFDAKGDEGYFVGYSLSSKSFRVFNKRTKKIEENLHVDFLENKSIEKGTSPDWLFDIDTLTNSMNYVPVIVVAGTSSTKISCTKENAQLETSNEAAKKDDGIPNNNSLQKEQQEVSRDKEVPESSQNSNPTASSKVSTNDSFELTSSSTVETKVSTVSSPVPTKSLSVPLNVWVLVDCPSRMRPIRMKWVLKNKKDERGIVIRNKARLVTQGHTQEEGIDYEEIFAPFARIEAIRLFLDYASYMGFTVYQMDVKSAFLYGTIDEEVYVIQLPGFQDPEFLHRVYKMCREFEALMHDKFQMSAMGELNFFLRLKVLQKKDGIFLSQDKYVGDILKKFRYTDIRAAKTPMDRENP